MYILDTNVLSELMKESPDAAVATWVSSVNKQDLYTTTITLAEISYGIERLPSGKRRSALKRAFKGIIVLFQKTTLCFDSGEALLYGAVVATREASGYIISVLDAQIASICLSRSEAVLVTRNTKDFEGLALKLLNPWE